jgi:hypothetical protein
LYRASKTDSHKKLTFTKVEGIKRLGRPQHGGLILLNENSPNQKLEEDGAGKGLVERQY